MQKLLKNFVLYAIQSLEMEPFVSEAAISACEGDIVEIIKQYEQHPSIIEIKVNVTLGGNFTFMDIIPHDIIKRILELTSKKQALKNDIPAKILIGSNEIVSNYLTDIYNNSKNNRNYPSY